MQNEITSSWRLAVYFDELQLAPQQAAFFGEFAQAGRQQRMAKAAQRRMRFFMGFCACGVLGEELIGREGAAGLACRDIQSVVGVGVQERRPCGGFMPGRCISWTWPSTRPSTTSRALRLSVRRRIKLLMIGVVSSTFGLP